MRHPALISALIALIPLASCAAEVTRTPPRAPVDPGPAIVAPPPPAPPAARDDGRLPATVAPQRYSISLRIDPSQPRFSGTTTIQVDVPGPTATVVLHARDMHVSRALARVAGAEIAASSAQRTSHDGVTAEELVLTFSRAIPAGAAQIQIDYDAPFAADLAGLYRVQERGAWYAYTQFEPTDARRAFPCFDEPGFKTPYDVTLVTPRGLLALGNAPEKSHEDTADGMVAHHF